jgi:S1-C subfamily serine protease
VRIVFTGWACTSGFDARGIDDGKLYVVTAGHCIAGSGLFAQWSHHGAVVGRAALDAFADGAIADAGAIEIAAADVSNAVYGPSRDAVRDVTAAMPNGAQRVGADVCRSGATSGWTCGHIVAVARETVILGKRISRTWWTDFPSASGDSGAPLTDADGRLVGIVVATTPTQSVYSTVDDVGAALNVRPCLDRLCS